ncbi:hypothetical protein HYH03_003834 [Edaphochlamys debaryana]|uniref:Jacalin-type lectin domain-containing protein n=1 Tax=Edaphochlamys debaryana TaxID=47281 RepID=A0A835YAD7_9CHLO|nr:hypothetical protein HYH03_003834 [Edaphochlamys debaryana]|eukprot:KAG2498074.1 hypothetical protein HYH03_003834 [Edaphochlamys debaryana]
MFPINNCMRLPLPADRCTLVTEFFGGVGDGTSFDDTPLADGGKNPITRIDWRSGFWFAYLQLSYGGVPSEMHGTDQGGDVFPGVALGSGELITSLVVYTNIAPPGVARLDVITTERTFFVGSEQPLNDPDSYDQQFVTPDKPDGCSSPNQGHLIAIQGWANNWLAAIAFVWSWPSTVECTPFDGYSSRTDLNWVSSAPSGQLDSGDAAREHCDASDECLAWNSQGAYLSGAPSGWIPSAATCSYFKTSACPELPGFTLQLNVDHNGDDRVRSSASDVETFAEQCLSLGCLCKGFNTNGWLKYDISNPQVDRGYEGSCQGLYTRDNAVKDPATCGCPAVPKGFVFRPDVDHPGDDLTRSTAIDIAGMAKDCLNDCRCVGFNTDGNLKGDVSSPEPFDCPESTVSGPFGTHADSKAFDDTDLVSNGDSPITRIVVQSKMWITSIQLQYGNEAGPLHGPSKGYLGGSTTFDLDPNEVITSAVVYTTELGWMVKLPAHVAALELRTSSGRTLQLGAPLSNGLPFVREALVPAPTDGCMAKLLAIKGSLLVDSVTGLSCIGSISFVWGYDKVMDIVALFKGILRVASEISEAGSSFPEAVRFGYNFDSSWFLYDAGEGSASQWRNAIIDAVTKVESGFKAPLDKDPEDLADWVLNATVTITGKKLKVEAYTTQVQWLLQTLTGFSLSSVGAMIPSRTVELAFASDLASGLLDEVSIPLTIPLMAGSCLATDTVISVDTSGGHDFSAKLSVSCPALQIPDTTLAVSSVDGEVSASFDGTLSFLDGFLTINTLELVLGTQTRYLIGAGSGRVAGFDFSIRVDTSSPLTLSASFPEADLGKLLSELSSFVPDSFPNLLGDGLAVKVYASDIGSGVFGVTAETSNGLFADLVFDAKGLLAANAGLPADISLEGLLQTVGVTMPFDTKSILSISKPSYSMVMPRADLSAIQGLRFTAKTPASARPPGVTGSVFSLGLSLPGLSLSNLPCDLKVTDLAHLFFSIKQDITLLDGRMILSGIQIEPDLDASALRSSISASFMGLELGGNLTIPVRKGSKPIIDVRAIDVNLASMLTSLWGDAPEFVKSKLQGLTFPKFDLSQENGLVVAEAGPVEGITLSLAIDVNGLRFLKLSTGAEDCLGLGDVIKGVGLSGKAEVPDVMKVCGPSLELVTDLDGVPNAVLPDGTELLPHKEAGFSLTMPDLGIMNMPADLVADGGITISIPGSFKAFNEWATFSDLTFNGLSKTHLSASVKLSVPDLGMSDAECKLEYDGTASEYTFTITGHASLIFDAITMDALSLTVAVSKDSPTTLRGSATGSLAGSEGTLGFSFMLPSEVPKIKPPPSFSLAIPKIDLGAALKSFGDSATSLLPDFLLDAKLPTFSMSSYMPEGASIPVDGVYNVTAGPTDSGIQVDLVFDKSGILMAEAVMDSSLDLGEAMQNLIGGVALPFDVSGLVVISKPAVSVVSKRAGTVFSDLEGPTGMMLSFGLQVPQLLGDNTVQGSMLLADGNGNTQTSFEIGAVKASGVIADAADVTASITIADKESKAHGAPAINFAFQATDVSGSRLFRALFESTPEFILSILDEVSFASVDLSYDGSSFGMSASPDLSKVPGLGEVIDFLHFNPNDIKIRPLFSAPGALELAIAKTWPLDIGSPFVGTPEIGFAVALSQQRGNTQIACKGSFTGVMRVPILEPPNIEFEFEAGVSFDSMAPAPFISFLLGASVQATGSPFHIKDFPWIQVSTLGGAVGIQPLVNPPFVNLRNFQFAASGVVLDTSVEMAMLYDQPSAQFALKFALENFDLEHMLSLLGIDVDLGPFDVGIRAAKFSFSESDVMVESVHIPAGLYVEADMDFLDMPFDGFKANIGPDGFSLSASAHNVLSANPLQQALQKVQVVADE